MDIANSILENQTAEAVRRLPYGLDPVLVGGKPYTTPDGRLGAKCHRGHPHLYHMSDVIARNISCTTCSVDNTQFHRNLNTVEEIFQQPFTMVSHLTIQHPKVPIILTAGDFNDAVLEKGKLRITVKNRNIRSTKLYIKTILLAHLDLFDESVRERIKEWAS